MKKAVLLLLALVTAFALCACGSSTDTYDYSSYVFPNYSEINPIRYLEKNERGHDCNGWQDMGTTGEIRTVGVAMGDTATYQFYSWYIRNDLQSLYGNVELPSSIEKMPGFLVSGNGHAVLWRSMGLTPDSIKLLGTKKISGENKDFLLARYELTTGDTVKLCLVYLMQEGETFSACSFLTMPADEELVTNLADGIVGTWKTK